MIDFLIDWEYDVIADNLLNLYFALTGHYLQDDSVTGDSEKLSSALFDLKELHLAIKAIGEKDKGFIRLTYNKE